LYVPYKTGVKLRIMIFASSVICESTMASASTLKGQSARAIQTVASSEAGQDLNPETLGRAEWFCIHTKPQKESRTAARLGEDLGLETYYPRLKQQRIIRRANRVVIGPLFPRYLFCRFNFATQYRAVRYAQDVIDVVSFGQVPAVVSDALIEGIKSWAGEAVDVIILQPGLRRGDRVEIIDGPLQGLQAVIEHEMPGRNRVAIVLSILERGVQTTISRSQIARV